MTVETLIQLYVDGFVNENAFLTFFSYCKSSDELNTVSQIIEF